LGSTGKYESFSKAAHLTVVQNQSCLPVRRNNTEVRVESTPGHGLVRPGPSEVKEVSDNPEAGKAKGTRFVE
jgi:hypothetical protein